MNEQMMTTDKVEGYKAFDGRLRCNPTGDNPFAYRVGRSYKCEDAVPCEIGFHFCKNPMDVRSFYDLHDSRFARVEGSGKTVTEVSNESEKSCTTNIKIMSELSIFDLVLEGMAYLNKLDVADLTGYVVDNNPDTVNCITSVTSPKTHSLVMGSTDQIAAVRECYRQAICRGSDSVAVVTGYKSLAAVCDFNSVALATGRSATAVDTWQRKRAANLAIASRFGLAASKRNIALSQGGRSQTVDGLAIAHEGVARAELGGWIVCTEYRHDKLFVKTAQIDGKKFKPGVWYRLSGNKLVRANV